ncbi:RluA family pseudouridine synthase [Oceanibacterium hippocampi]|uniref:Pseudouridine synthase n=1 Tax=Oceanibacterium hippocampi TaxID=745714 RepID=A0A1Y5TUH1_9PROT|nr:RluA family pseudouridine synthase [Oceanibacterium hippocampi]SLN73088.1 Ribosomal large subunit pseudouridine synthase D [Oceanibacterium hippocampi]
MEVLETEYRIAVAESEAGDRLDRVLAAHLPDLSRTRVKALIEAEKVRSGAQTIAEPSYRVKPQQIFILAVPVAVDAEPAAQEIPLDIVHEDDDLVIVDKPPGLVVHPAPGNADRTLVNALIHHCGSSLSGIGGVRRPGIVHRIDKDTSGLLIVAKNDMAHAALAKQFAAHSLERHYRAIVWGVPRSSSGEIRGNIGRDPRHRKRMAVVADGGKAAITHYRVLERFGELASLVECRLETGRTHQIRVHMTHIGHPLVGDSLYGRNRRGRQSASDASMREALNAFPRQALHAASLGIIHPRTGKTLKYLAEIPNDMKTLLVVLRNETMRP